MKLVLAAECKGKQLSKYVVPHSCTFQVIQLLLLQYSCTSPPIMYNLPQFLSIWVKVNNLSVHRSLIGYLWHSKVVKMKSSFDKAKTCLTVWSSRIFWDLTSTRWRSSSPSWTAPAAQRPQTDGRTAWTVCPCSFVQCGGPSRTGLNARTHKAAQGACQRPLVIQPVTRGEREEKSLCAACCTLEGACVLMRCSDLCNPKTL